MAGVVAAATLAGYWVFADWAFPRNLEGETLNLRFRLRGERAAGPQTAVVLVDDRSLAVYGRWPPARRLFAEAVRRLRADGARVIAFDLLFAEADVDGDDALAAAVREAGNVVIPFAFIFKPTADGPPPAAEPVRASAYRHLQLTEGYVGGPVLAASGMVSPRPELAQAAATLGHVSVLYDTDGSLRFDYPVLEYDWDQYPSLSVETARLFLGLGRDKARVRLGEGIDLGELEVPTDESMRLLVDYLGPPGRVPTYSFVDLLAGRVPAGSFAGKAVVIGASVLGINDAFSSPFSPLLPGAERQAVVIDQILRGRHLIRRNWVRVADMGLVVGLAAAGAALAASAPMAWVAPAGLGLLALWAVACQIAFVWGGVWLHVTAPALSGTLALAGAWGLRSRAGEAHRRRAARELAISEERYALAARGATDGLWDWDLGLDRVYFAPRWQAMIGEEEEAVVAAPAHWLARVDPLDRPLVEAAIEAHLLGRTAHFEHAYRLTTADGRERWMLARGEAVRDGQGRARRFAGSQSDITERKRAEQALVDSAFRDALTGLANRALLLDRIAQALARPMTGEGGGVAVLAVDVDGFRRLAETLGPVGADHLLIALARRLEGASPAGSSVARLFADTFALLVSAGEAEEMVAALRAALSQPFALETGAVALSVSIGIVTSLAEGSVGEGGVPERGGGGTGAPNRGDADELLRDAILAAHAARGAGLGQTRRFAEDLRAKVERRFDLETALRHAVEAGCGGAGGLELHYQPIVALADGRVTGFEALMRWRRDERGLIPPGDFIPLAEETGLVVPMGSWALFEACRQAARWRADPGGAIPFTIAVNVAGRQFTESDLPGVVEAALAEAGVPPSALKVEVTESMMMADPERTAAILRTLIARGVRISVDDFGTGYSSLSYLHRLPFQTLKIDRSFVIRLGDGPEALEIVRSIVALAHSLGRDLVAEGIETEAQAAILRELGVERGQGYLFARPAPAATFDGRLRPG